MSKSNGVISGQDIMKLVHAIKNDDKRGFYITQPIKNTQGKMTYKRKYLNKSEITKIKKTMTAKVDRSNFRDINQVIIYGENKKKRTYKRKEKKPVEPQTIQSLSGGGRATLGGYRLPSLANQFYSQGNRAYVGRNIETNASQGIKDLEQLQSKEIERLRGIVNRRPLKEYDDKALQAQANKLIQKEQELTYLKDRLVEFEDQMKKLIAQRIDPKVIDDMKKERTKLIETIRENETTYKKEVKDYQDTAKTMREQIVNQEQDLKKHSESGALLQKLKELIGIGAIRVPTKLNFREYQPFFKIGVYDSLINHGIKEVDRRGGFHNLGGIKGFTEHRDIWEDVIRNRTDKVIIEYLQNAP